VFINVTTTLAVENSLTPVPHVGFTELRFGHHLGITFLVLHCLAASINVIILSSGNLLFNSILPTRYSDMSGQKLPRLDIPM
jgi:hypothetical protein